MIVCTSCGKENQDLYKFCLGCGGDLSGLPSAATRVKTAAAGGGAASSAAAAPAAPATVEPKPPVFADMGPMEVTDPGSPYPSEPTHSKWSAGAPPEASSAKTWSDADPPVAPVSPVSWLEQPASSPEAHAHDHHDHDHHDHDHHDRDPGDQSSHDYSSHDYSSNDYSSHDQSAPASTPEDTTDPVTTESPTVSTADPGPMRPCPTCGAPVPVSFAFCGSCGGRVGEVKPAEVAGGARAAASPQTGVHGRLVLVRPDGSEGGSHPLVDGENLIGRGAGPLFEADGYLSPRHASLVLNAAGLVVRDAGSLNGVFIKLPTEEELLDGDIFRIGQELIRFEAVPPPEPLDDGTELLGSPNPGFWGRLAVIVGRDQDAAAYPLFGDAIILGRERGDIVFPEDGYVSGTHARVSARDGRFWLSDLNSSNGTFLRIHGERPVTSGSYLLMGQQLFRVNYP